MFNKLKNFFKKEELVNTTFYEYEAWLFDFTGKSEDYVDTCKRKFDEFSRVSTEEKSNKVNTVAQNLFKEDLIKMSNDTNELIEVDILDEIIEVDDKPVEDETSEYLMATEAAESIIQMSKFVKNYDDSSDVRPVYSRLKSFVEHYKGPEDISLCKTALSLFRF